MIPAIIAAVASMLGSKQSSSSPASTAPNMKESTSANFSSEPIPAPIENQPVEAPENQEATNE